MTSGRSSPNRARTPARFADIQLVVMKIFERDSSRRWFQRVSPDGAKKGGPLVVVQTVDFEPLPVKEAADF